MNNHRHFMGLFRTSRVSQFQKRVLWSTVFALSNY